MPNGFVWDDVHLVAKNPYLTSARGIGCLFSHDLWTASALGTKSEFYRPLAMATFALDRALSGGHAAGHHVGNALVHGANAALLFAALLVYLFSLLLVRMPDRAVASAGAMERPSRVPVPVPGRTSNAPPAPRSNDKEAA